MVFLFSVQSQLFQCFYDLDPDMESAEAVEIIPHVLYLTTVIKNGQKLQVVSDPDCIIRKIVSWCDFNSSCYKNLKDMKGTGLDAKHPIDVV